MEESEKEVGRNYSLYPSYQELDSAQISTPECIDNFNKNFGKDGIFKDAREEIKFFEPVSTETLLSEDGFEKMKSMLEKWDEYVNDKNLKADDATADLSGKEK